MNSKSDRQGGLSEFVWQPYGHLTRSTEVRRASISRISLASLPETEPKVTSRLGRTSKSCVWQHIQRGELAILCDRVRAMSTPLAEDAAKGDNPQLSENI